MASGSFATSTTNSSAPNNFLLKWSSTSNVSANTTTFSWELYQAYNGATSVSSGNPYRRTRNPVIKVKNAKDSTWLQTWSPSYNVLQCYVGTKIANGSVTIPNNDDGTLTVSISVSGEQYVSSAWKTTSGTGTAVVDTIPRYSSISVASSVTMGTATNVTITQASSSYASRLYYKTASGSYVTLKDFAKGSTSYTYSWIPYDDSNNIPNATSETYTLLVRTYTSGTVGSGSYLDTTKSVTANVPTTYKPTVTLSGLADTITKPSGWGYIVNYSKLKVTANFTGSHNSTLKSTTITFGTAESKTSTSATASQTYTMSNVVNATSFKITVTVTDSRGRTGSATTTISAITYNPPQIQIQMTRGTVSGSTFTPDAQGTNAQVNAKWTITNVATNLNTATIKIAGITYDIGTTYSQTSWKQIGLITSNLDISNDYSYSGTIADKFKTTNVTGIVNKSTVALSLWSDGTNNGVSIGRIATEQGFNVFEMDSYMQNNLTVGGITTSLFSTPADSGFTSDQYGNLKHKRSNTGDSWHFDKSDGNAVFRINLEQGQFSFYAYGDASTNRPVTLGFYNTDTSSGFQSSSFLRAYNEHNAGGAYGNNIVFQSGSNMVIGAGESANGFYNLLHSGSTSEGINETGENLVLLADSALLLLSNANSIDNRRGFALGTDGYLRPIYQGQLANGYSAIGHPNYRVAGVYSNAFHTANGQIGTIQSTYGTSTDVNTSTVTAIQSVSIPAGIWVVVVSVYFGANATGTRKVKLSTTSADYSNDRTMTDTRTASNNGATMSSFTTILNLSSATTYYINVWQNSGATLACQSGIKAVRIA